MDCTVVYGISRTVNVDFVKYSYGFSKNDEIVYIRKKTTTSFIENQIFTVFIYYFMVITESILACHRFFKCKNNRWICALASIVNVTCLLLYLLLYFVLLESFTTNEHTDTICNLTSNGTKKCTYLNLDKFRRPLVFGLPPPQMTVDPHIYPYLVQQASLCSSAKDALLLLVGVCSEGSRSEHRKAIRDSWGHVTRERSDVRLVFLMGRPVNKSLQSFISLEAQEFGDVIQEDFLDTYGNLSVKSVMLLRWASRFCPNAAFVLKTDDDMFIHLPNLLNYLSAIRGQPRQLFGHLHVKAKPNRSRASKRFSLIRSYRGRYFPNYLSGGAYVMSADAVKDLYKVAIRTAIFLVEDVFITGMCAERAGIIPKDHGSFHVNKNDSVCSYKNAISCHDFKPEELRQLWKAILMTKCRKQ